MVGKEEGGFNDVEGFKVKDGIIWILIKYNKCDGVLYIYIFYWLFLEDIS